MSLAKLFFKKGNFISTIELDIIINESASASSRVTENPVENGANMNDHIIIEPMTFSVSGVVSNVSSNFVSQLSVLSNRSKAADAWEALLELQISRTPFTLVQGLKQYQNVVILTISESQDKDTANGLFFTATMKEFIFVGSEIITEEQFNEPTIADKMVQAIAGGLKKLGL